MTAEEFREIVKAAIANPRAAGVDRCILCGQPAAGVAAFLANAAMCKRLGVPAGKQRCFLYGLCASCAESPGCGDRVEQRFIAAMQVQ
jgi:hypothetical protein